MISLDHLRKRAEMLASVRSFFSERNVLEVDTPLLCPKANIDTHIDLIEATCCKEKRFLHTSPEHTMKRLLSNGSGDIYQLSHVFRDHELGHRHNPEFMMVEWYRVGFSFSEMIQETTDLCQLFLQTKVLAPITYRQAFIDYADIDPYTDSILTIQDRLYQEEIEATDQNRDNLLNLILGNIVEPQLGKTGLQAMTHYPASQAAMAIQTEQEGHVVAERFEMYYKGYELANGYHETSNSEEMFQRFSLSNQERKELGKQPLPIDNHFLACLNSLPDCCGVAVGFDRLLMLNCHMSNITDIFPFSWSEL